MSEPKAKIEDVLNSFTELEKTILHHVLLNEVKKNAGEYLNKDEKAVDEYLRYLITAVFDDDKRAAADYILNYTKDLTFEKTSKEKMN